MGLLEIFGYMASVVTAISLMMKNIHRLRWWNFFGATAFSAYGAMIGAWPVFALNGFIAIVDIYYLVAMSRRKEYFDLLEIDIKNSIFTKRFLDFYQNDIANFFPSFSLSPETKYKAYFCLRDCRPVGLVLFSTISEKELLVELDYAIPEYRDMKNGKYFYHEGLKRLGIDNKKQFIIKDPNERHQHYLNAVGFKRTGDENGIPIYKR